MKSTNTNLFLKIISTALVTIIWSSTFAHAQNNEKQTDAIVIDGRGGGRIFQGIGAVSAGASSRLLYDYPEPERSQILDYLFKPNYGASLQILKVEIGGDTNSTDGAEASHMRSPDEVNCNRGYEWWLMTEAKKRNPDIKLAGLAWGTPGWVGDNFWTEKNIDYHLAWLGCAEENGLTIDYMGGWNESGYDVDWYIKWDEALEKHYPEVEIIGADDCCVPKDKDIWRVVDDMNKSEEFMKAVDHVGVHFACGHRSEHTECYSPQRARDLDKPLWMSENSAQNHDIGGLSTTRALNRMYIDARISGYMTWSPISAWYANIELADTGLMLAEWPWSGFYLVDKNIWAFAHTAQFTKPGWKYIDSASGYLPAGASYVTLQSSDGSKFSTIIEALDAEVVENATFSVRGKLRADSVHVFATNMRSSDKNDYFVDEGAVLLDNGVFELTVRPGFVYSVTTTTGQKKGMAKPGARLSDQMEMPYEEDFEQYGEGELARFYSDINGAFETTPCGAGREGMCYRQVLNQEPINWKDDGVRPSTVLGDPRWWGDYTVSADFLLEQPGYVELVGRVSAVRAAFSSRKQITGYHLQVSSSGKWELYRQDMEHKNETERQVIASGRTSVKAGQWHQMALQMKGQSIDIIIDGDKVKSVQDAYFTTGQVALVVSPWQNAQFDNIKITRNGEWPGFVPKNNMSIVTATSEHPENYRGYDYAASNAIDDRPETVWHSEWMPKVPLPQSITIDLGGRYRLQGLMYQPRLDGHTGGMITRYNIYLSTDGVNFKKVTSGSWPVGTATKIAPIGPGPDNQQVRYVRLEATEGVNGAASAGEIGVIIAQ